MKSLPLLTFHAIDDRPSVISFPPALFARGIAGLNAGGFRTITLSQAAECIARARPFPDRSLVMTFDDGYRSVYERAWPVLASYGMTATVFLTVGEPRNVAPDDRLPELSGRAMLSWREIREMGQGGIDFGAHTLTHPDLTRVAPEQAEREIRLSKQIVENGVGSPANSFAYPYGAFDHTSQEIARQHFECACSADLGFVTASSSLYALERLDAYYLRSGRMFELFSTRWLEPYISVRAIFRRLRRTALPLAFLPAAA